MRRYPQGYRPGVTCARAAGIVPGYARILTAMTQTLTEPGKTDADLCEGHDLIRNVLERIGDKWSVVVICKLSDSTRGFNELRRLSGPSPITQRMLSATLRRLERDGLVTRTVHNTKPPRVDYTLTPRGLSLLDIVQSLARWAQDNASGIRDSRMAFHAGQA